MAIENWLSGAEMHAITIIVKAMDDAKISWDSIGAETGGDVLRIPMSKLKKAGYKFLGCDILDDISDMEKLRGSLEKLDMETEDTEESLEALSKALTAVLEDISAGSKATPAEQTDIPKLPVVKMIGKHKIYPL